VPTLHNFGASGLAVRILEVSERPDAVIDPNSKYFACRKFSRGLSDLQKSRPFRTATVIFKNLHVNLLVFDTVGLIEAPDLNSNARLQLIRSFS
jgi:hypothetical protein